MKNIILILFLFKNAIGFSQTDQLDIEVNSISPNIQKYEVSLAVCKHNPDKIILGWNSFRFHNTEFSQGWAFSSNGGSSFIGSNQFPTNNSIKVGGDPFVGFDATKNPFMVTMDKNTGGLGFINSTDPINGWSNSILAKTSSSNKDNFLDKPMGIAVDDNLMSSGLNNIYLAATDFSNKRSLVFFRRIAGTDSFSTPITLENRRQSQGANVQIGINNKVYVTWTDYDTLGYPGRNIGFAVSNNNGASFNSNPAEFGICGIRYSGYGLNEYCKARVNDFPSMAIDRTCLSKRGRVYICWADQVNCNASPSNKGAIIKMRFTDDDGLNWSNPINVSKIENSNSWMPSISVDDKTGLVTVAYYTFDEDCEKTNTLLSYSFDNGVNWFHVKVSDQDHEHKPVTGSGASNAGDYLSCVTYNNVAYVAWNDNRNGNYSIFLSKVLFNLPKTIHYAKDYKLEVPLNNIFTQNTKIMAKGKIWMDNSDSFTIAPGVKFHLVSETAIELSPNVVTENSNTILEIGPLDCYDIGTTQPPPDGVREIVIDQNIQLKNTQSGFKIYPNPTSQLINIESLNGLESFKFIIFDQAGKLVITGECIKGGKITTNISYLSSGIYFLKINNENISKISINR